MSGRFDREVLASDPGHRGVLLQVLEAALSAVDPGAAVERSLRRDGSTLSVAGREIVIGRRVVVLALGKAAPAMADAAVSILEGVDVTGVVASPDGRGPAGLDRIAGGHPIPTDASVRAGTALLEAARAAGPDDLVLVLVSGGGSAIAEVPAGTLTLGDLAGTSEALLRSGADIEQVNTVRTHLSLLKGGGLAAAAEPARIVSLLLSDVVGSPTHTIASGPTVPDPTTSGDALAVVTRWGAGVPARVLDHLREGAAAETSGRGAAARADADRVVAIVADGTTAARAAVVEARRCGIPARVAGTTLAGEARRVGADVAAAALALPEPGMLVWAGETTVMVTGAGVGGRNQETALAAALALDGTPGVLVASLGTDGADGPTAAAGGVGDGGTIGRGRDRGLDASAALDDNDAYPYLAVTRDLLVTGPTGTNVGDLVVAWRWE